MLIVEDPEVFYAGKENFPMREETYKIIGLAMEVHKIFGKGCLEIVYKDVLEIEFTDNLMPFEREKPYTIEYKGRLLKRKYNADFVAYENLILEIKAQSGIYDDDIKQTINYLAFAKSNLGLIVNFGENSLTFKALY